MTRVVSEFLSHFQLVVRRLHLNHFSACHLRANGEAVRIRRQQRVKLLEVKNTSAHFAMTTKISKWSTDLQRTIRSRLSPLEFLFFFLQLSLPFGLDQGMQEPRSL